MEWVGTVSGSRGQDRHSGWEAGSHLPRLTGAAEYGAEILASLGVARPGWGLMKLFGP